MSDISKIMAIDEETSKLLGINLVELAQKQAECLKSLCVERLEKVIAAVKNNDWDKLKEMTSGLDEDFINFRYSDCDRNIIEIANKIQELQQIK